MNQVRIISTQEETPKHTIAFEIDSKDKLVLDFDINYLYQMGLEHIKYKVSKAKIKAPKRKLREKESEIIGIIAEYGDIMLSSILNAFENNDRDILLKTLNTLEIESYVLSSIIETVTNKVFDLLKKDELK